MYTLVGALREGVSEAVKFDLAINKLSQVADDGSRGVNQLRSTIINLSKDLGVSSSELADAAVAFSQAGLNATRSKVAVEAFAKTLLSASFDSPKKTIEAMIATLSQFEGGVEKLSERLGAIASVSAAFAVESGDLTTVITKAGGAAATAGASFNELLALFTSIRATTRESADSISTGLRSILAYAQREDSIEALKAFNIQLRYTKAQAEELSKAGLGDGLEGQFVGPLRAIQKISEGLRNLRSTDPRYSAIVEDLGGVRQISRVLPLIQEYATAQKALAVARFGEAKLEADAATRQDAVVTRITKIRETYGELTKDLVSSQGFKQFIDGLKGISDALAGVLKNLGPVIPSLAAFTVARAAVAAAPFTAGAARAAFGNQAQPRRFAEGGPVPLGLGTPGRDSVHALVMPGEYVLRREAAQNIGYENLERMNKTGRIGYAAGGRVRPGQGVVTAENVRAIIKEYEAKTGIKFSALAGKVRLVDNLGVGDQNQAFGSFARAARTVTLNRSTIDSIAKLRETIAHEFGHALDLKLASGTTNRLLSESAGSDTARYGRREAELQRRYDREDGTRYSKAYSNYYYSRKEGFARTFASHLAGDPEEGFRSRFNRRGFTSLLDDAARATNENYRPSLFQRLKVGASRILRRFAVGGPVPLHLGTPGKDSVLAALEPGEFVLRTTAAQKLGRSRLDYMNTRGEIPGFADGGEVGPGRGRRREDAGDTTARIQARFPAAMEQLAKQFGESAAKVFDRVFRNATKFKSTESVDRAFVNSLLGSKAVSSTDADRFVATVLSKAKYFDRNIATRETDRPPAPENASEVRRARPGLRNTRSETPVAADDRVRERDVARANRESDRAERERARRDELRDQQERARLASAKAASPSTAGLTALERLRQSQANRDAAQATPTATGSRVVPSTAALVGPIIPAGSGGNPPPPRPPAPPSGGPDDNDDPNRRRLAAVSSLGFGLGRPVPGAPGIPATPAQQLLFGYQGSALQASANTASGSPSLLDRQSSLPLLARAGSFPGVAAFVAATEAAQRARFNQTPPADQYAAAIAALPRPAPSPASASPTNIFGGAFNGNLGRLNDLVPQSVRDEVARRGGVVPARQPGVRFDDFANASADARLARSRVNFDRLPALVGGAVNVTDPNSIANQLRGDEVARQQARLAQAIDRQIRVIDRNIPASERVGIAQRLAAEAYANGARVLTDSRGNVAGLPGLASQIAASAQGRGRLSRFVNGELDQQGRGRFGRAADAVGSFYGSLRGDPNDPVRQRVGQRAFLGSFILPTLGAQFGATQEQIQTAAGTGNDRTALTQNGLAQAAQGGGIGLAIAAGVGLGPVGVVAAGVAGAGALLVSSLSETARRIQDAKLGTAVERLSSVLSLSLRAGRGLDADPAALTSLAEARAAAAFRSVDETRSVFGRDANAFGESLSRENRSALLPAAQQFIQILSDEAVKIGRSNPNGNAGDLAQRLNSAAGRQYIQTIADVRSVRPDTVLRELVETVRQGQESAQAERNLTALESASQRVTTAFDQLAQSAGDAYRSTAALRSGSEVAGLPFSRGGTVGVLNPGEVLSRLGGADTTNFRSALDVVRRAGGADAQGFVDRAEAANQAGIIGPQIVRQLVEGGYATPGSTPPVVRARSLAENAFFPQLRNVTDEEERQRTFARSPAQKEALDFLVGAISDSLRKNESDPFKDFRGSPQAFISNTLTNSPYGQAVTRDQAEFAGNVARAGQDLVGGLAVLRQRETGVADIRERVPEAELAAARYEADRRAGGENGGRFLSLQQLLEPFERRQTSLLVGTGLNASDAGGIAARLSARQADARRLVDERQAALGDRPEFERLSREFDSVVGEADRLQQALRNLADGSSRLAAIQERLAALNADREGRLGFAERFVTADPTERQRLRRGQILAAQVAQNGASFDTLNDTDRRFAVEGLRLVGNTAFRDGRTGNQVLEQALARTGILNQGAEAERDELLARRGQVAGGAGAAGELLARTLEGENRKFLAELLQVHERFFSQLNRSQSAERVREAETRRDAAVQQGADLGRAEPQAALLRRAGVTTNEQLGRARAFATNGAIDAFVTAASSSSRPKSLPELNQDIRRAVEANEAALANANATETFSSTNRSTRQAGAAALLRESRVFADLPAESRNSAITDSVERFNQFRAARFRELALEAGLTQPVANAASTRDLNLSDANRQTVERLRTRATTEVLAELAQFQLQSRAGQANAERQRRLDEIVRDRFQDSPLNPYQFVPREFRTGEDERRAGGQFFDPRELIQLQEALRNGFQSTPLEQHSRAVELNRKQVEDLTKELTTLTTRLRQSDPAKQAAAQSVLGPAAALGFASGGSVPPLLAGPRGTDTVPAMLTPGEHVINRASAQANRALLERINAARGPVQYYQVGGTVVRGAQSQSPNLGQVAEGYKWVQEKLSAGLGWLGFQDGGPVVRRPSPPTLGQIAQAYVWSADKINKGLSWLGFAEGGIVPFTPYGFDNAPTLRLSPAERARRNRENLRFLYPSSSDRDERARQETEELARELRPAPVPVAPAPRPSSRARNEERIRSALTLGDPAGGTALNAYEREAERQAGGLPAGRREESIARQLRNIDNRRAIQSLVLRQAFAGASLLPGEDAQFAAASDRVGAREVQDARRFQERFGGRLSRADEAARQSVQQEGERRAAERYLRRRELARHAPTGGVVTPIGNRSDGGLSFRRFALGGLVTGSGVGDSVPSLLAPGEFVLNRRAVQAYGADNLARANSNPAGNGGGSQDAATRSAENMAKLGTALSGFSTAAGGLTSALTTFGSSADSLAKALDNFPREVSHQHTVNAVVSFSGQDLAGMEQSQKQWVMTYVNGAINEALGKRFPDANSGYPTG